jgi:hypothetical protein
MILKQISFLSRVVKVGASYPVPAFGRVLFCVTLFCIETDWEMFGDPRQSVDSRTRGIRT